MRTTLDLPDDVHHLLRAIARDRHETLSQTTAAILRRALTAGDPVLERSARTGLPIVRLGRTDTSEDVRSLEDDR